LVVDFDTTVNSSPTDISGQGNHGTFYGGASYSAADKAFNFDGTNDTIYNSGIGNWSDNINHTMSFWMKTRTTSGVIGVPFAIYDTPNTENEHSGFWGTIGNSIQFFHFSNDYTYTFDLQPNTWYHFVAVYNGSPNTQKVYANGVELTLLSTAGATVNAALSLGTNPKLTLGGDYGRSNYYFNGQISNPKIYNVALEASEVKKLYNLGRTGRSMVVSDTAVGIGKVPEAQLDVRGNLNVSSFIKYDSAWFYASDGNTSGTDAFSDYTGFVPWGSILTGSKHFTTASASTSGGYYTAPVDGIYHFDTSVLNYPDARASGYTNIAFSVNDSTAITGTDAFGFNRKLTIGGQHSITASATYRLDEGDTVKVYVSNIDCYTQERHAFFSGYLVTRI
jgi:hypothetical protein